MTNRIAKNYTKTCRCGVSFTTTNIEQTKCGRCNRKGKTYKIHKSFGVIEPNKIKTHIKKGKLVVFH